MLYSEDLCLTWSCSIDIDGFKSKLNCSWNCVILNYNTHINLTSFHYRVSCGHQTNCNTCDNKMEWKFNLDIPINNTLEQHADTTLYYRQLTTIVNNGYFSRLSIFINWYFIALNYYGKWLISFHNVIFNDRYTYTLIRISRLKYQLILTDICVVFWSCVVIDRVW